MTGQVKQKSLFFTNQTHLIHFLEALERMMKQSPESVVCQDEGVAGSYHSHLLSGFGLVLEKGTRVYILTLLMLRLKRPR